MPCVRAPHRRTAPPGPRSPWEARPSRSGPELPRARVTDPDGTYLVWVDARSYLRDEADLDRAVRACRVAVTPGEDFGERYAGWFRINTALPAGELAAALPRLCRAIRAVGAVGAAEAGSTAGAAEAGSTAGAAGSQSRSVPTH